MSTKLAMWLIVLSGVPAVAAAQVAPEQLAQARARFEAGEAAYEANDYEEAVRSFTAAYRLMDGHQNQGMILYNIASAQEELGQTQAAIESYRRFLEEAPSDAPNRTLALERITLLEARGSAAPSTTEGLSALGIAGAVMLGVGGAGLLGFAIVGGVAVAEDSSLATRCGANAGRTCTEDDVSTLRTLTTTADVMLGVGLVLAAAGAVMLVIDIATGNDESSDPVTLSPLIGPGVAGVVARGSL